MPISDNNIINFTMVTDIFKLVMYTDDTTLLSQLSL